MAMGGTLGGQKSSLQEQQGSFPTRVHGLRGPGASEWDGAFKQQGLEVMGWQGQPRKTPCGGQILRRAGKESSVAAAR